MLRAAGRCESRSINTWGPSILYPPPPRARALAARHAHIQHPHAQSLTPSLPRSPTSTSTPILIRLQSKRLPAWLAWQLHANHVVAFRDVFYVAMEADMLAFADSIDTEAVFTGIVTEQSPRRGGSFCVR